MAGPENFSFDVSRYCDAAMERARGVFLGTGLALLGRVKELTPVRTGNLRANWQIVPDGQQVEIVGRVGPGGPPGPADLARLTAGTNVSPQDPGIKAVRDAQVGDKLRIVNPVIYARAVEHGREIEKQDGTVTHLEGRGMVAQTLIEAPRLAAEVLKRLTGSAGL